MTTRSELQIITYTEGEEIVQDTVQIELKDGERRRYRHPNGVDSLSLHDQTEFDGQNGTHIDHWDRNNSGTLRLDSGFKSISREPTPIYEITDHQNGDVLFRLNNLEVYREPRNR